MGECLLKLLLGVLRTVLFTKLGYRTEADAELPDPAVVSALLDVADTHVTAIGGEQSVGGIGAVGQRHLLFSIDA